MLLELKFDYHSQAMHIPDGFISDLKSLQMEFLDWVEEQPECIVNSVGKGYAYSYNADDFMRYINDIILKDSAEKAYFVLDEQYRKLSKNKIKLKF